MSPPTTTDAAAAPALIWAGYLHPWPLLAGALLVVNDHLLKGSGLAPDWLTGKLSDLAGLFFFPLLVCALVQLLVARRHAPGRRALAACCLATALLFALLQLAPPLAQAYRELGALVAGALAPLRALRPTVTMDPWDLVALPAVWLAWRHGRRFACGGERAFSAPRS